MIRYSAALILALCLLVVPPARAGLYDGAPSKDAIAYWRVSNPAPESLTPWAKRFLSDDIVKAVALFENDPASAAIAKASAWATTNAVPSAGVALMSTSEQRATYSKVVSDAIAAAQAKVSAIQSETPRNNAEAIQNISVEIPPRQPRDLAAELVIGAKPATSILETITGIKPDTTAPATSTIAGASVRSISADGWVRPLLWAIVGDRLLLATSERAMTWALANHAGDSDVLHEDWNTHRAAVAKGRTTAKPAASLLINFNAIRQDLAEQWEISEAFQYLNAWRLPNVRSVSLHMGVIDIARMESVKADPSHRVPPLLVLDACWSAKSDAPGQFMRTELTLDSVPGKQSAALVPDADVYIALRPNYRAMTDWVFQTYLTSIAGTNRAATASESWRNWLLDHRPALEESAQSFGLLGVIGVRGLKDPSSPPVMHWRSLLRTGVNTDRVAANLLRLTRIVGTDEKKDDLNRAPTVYAAPVASAWISGTAAWSVTQSLGVPVVVGGLSLNTFDPVQLIRQEALRADSKPPSTLPPLPVPNKSVKP